MIKSISYFLRGIRAVVKYEGIFRLISRGWNFLFSRLFVFDNYYIVSLDLGSIKNEIEADFLPDTENVDWKMITSNQEADELEKVGYHFGAYGLNLRASLDSDVNVFSVFVDKELAHIVCLADNLKGQKTIDYRPFSVDFKNGEIATGRALTMPKYRRLHLRIYSGFLVRRYGIEKGCKRIKGTVGEYNATLIASAKHGYLTILSICRYIKILCFKYHRESEMEPIKPKEVLEKKQGYRDKILKKSTK